MTKQCEHCGSYFNTETVAKCPACRKTKKKHHNKKRDHRYDEIGKFRRQEITDKKQVVNSFRRAEVCRYEREKGKVIYQNL